MLYKIKALLIRAPILPTEYNFYIEGDSFNSVRERVVTQWNKEYPNCVIQFKMIKQCDGYLWKD